MVTETALRKEIAIAVEFESTAAITEQRYNVIMKSLLEKCDTAIKSKDYRVVKQLQEIVIAWIKYFEAQRAHIQKAFSDRDSTKKPVLMFIDDQITFMGHLHKELLR